MGFVEEDFSRLKIPVHKIPVGAPDIFKHAPTLSVYPEFKAKIVSSIDLSIVLRYLGVMYQDGSPFLSISNLQKRKVEAAKWAGFPPSQDGKGFKKEYMDIIRGKYKPVNRMIIRMCRVQRNTDFSKLLVFEEAYSRELEKLLALNVKDADKIRKACNSFQADIDETSKHFLLDDDSDGNIETLLDEIENEQLELSPEQIAMKMASGEDPLDGYNPYNGYLPEKLTIKKGGQKSSAKKV